MYWCKREDCLHSYCMKISTTSLIYHLESKHNIKLVDNTIPVIEGKDESNDEFDLTFGNGAKYGSVKQDLLNKLLVEFVVEDM